MSLLDKMRLCEADNRLAVQRWKDANGYDDLIDAYAESARNLTAARARIAELEDWKRRADNPLRWLVAIAPLIADRATTAKDVAGIASQLLSEVNP